MKIFPDGTMTIQYAAERLGLTPATLYLAIQQRKLISHDTFGRMAVSQENISKWRATLGKPGRPKKHLTTVKQLQRGTYEPI